MGRHKKEVASVQVSFSTSAENAARARALAETLSKRLCGVRISMSAVLRLALERGLAELETKETMSE